MNSCGSGARRISVSAIWGQGSFAHICFESRGCRYRRAGHCIMCDYGAGKNLTAAQAVEALERLFREWPQPIERLLLGSCGSILDEYEINAETLEAILAFVARSTAADIIFETHYTTVRPDILQKLRDALPGKRLFIEMGLESSNEKTLARLRKYMNLDALSETLELIHAFNIDIMLNIFLGAPGLSPKEQISDAMHSAEWAYAHGVDNIVLFPANIKPNTELWKLYQARRYDLPSHWMLIELLRRLPDKLLANAAVSWYGDRQAHGVDTDILPPLSCDICGPLLQQFYANFMSQFSAPFRRACMDELIEAAGCSCRAALLKFLK